MHAMYARLRHILKCLSPPPLPLCAATQHADSVVFGIIFTCVAFLLLITLAVTGCFVVRKNTISKKGCPEDVSSQPDPEHVRI